MDVENPIVRKDYRPVVDIADELEDEINMLEENIGLLQTVIDNLKNNGFLSISSDLEDCLDALMMEYEDRNHIKEEIIRRGRV